MGLAKAWRVVQNHRGRIAAVSELGHGTTITVFLPATRYDELVCSSVAS